MDPNPTPPGSPPLNSTLSWDRFQTKFNRYLSLLRKYWWLVVFSAAAGLGVAAWRVAAQRVVYVSTARMMVSGKINLPDGGAFAEEVTYFMTTQGELMQDEAIRQRAEHHVRTTSPETPVTPLELIVKPLPQTSIFVLTAKGPEPQYPQKFLEAIMHEYIATRREMRAQKGEFAAGEIDEEIARVQGALHKEEEKLLTYQRENNVGFLEQEGNSAATFLAKLNTQLAELKNESQLLDLFEIDQQLARQRRNPGEAAHPDSTGAREGDPRSASGGSQMEYERTRHALEVLLAERAGYARDLLPKHPIMLELDAQIAQQKQLIDSFRKQSIEELKRRREAARLEIQNLETTIKDWETKAVASSQRLAEYYGIQAGIARIRGQLDSLSKSKGNVEITRNVDQEIVSVRQKATVAQPQRPEVAATLVAGLAIGLLIGIAGLVMFEPFVDRVASVSEFQSHFPERILAQIPHVSRIAGVADSVAMTPLLPEDERHAFAESLRSLRSSLFFLPVEGHPPKILFISSAMPNEGKSTVATNFAITLAQPSVRVLLVDGDLRCGKLHRSFELSNERGFADVLAGDCALYNAIQTTPVPGLSLLSRGSDAHNPGELFLSKDADRFLRAVSAQFDYVVIDSAPVMATDDSTSLAPKVDATIFVFRLTSSSVRAGTRSIALLRERQANVIGVICNDVPEAMQQYYYNRYPEYYAGSGQRRAGA